MKVLVFSSKGFEKPLLEEAGREEGHELEWCTSHLDRRTAVLARGYPAISTFANDRLDAPVLEVLHRGGTRLLALRCAGFNQVDLAAAEELGFTVARVPAYSPEAIAEHAVGMMLSLDRRIHRAWARVREGNFSLEGLMGFNLHGRVVGIVGLGRIGTALARILAGFGCRLLGADPRPAGESRELGVEPVSLEELLERADIVSLHCPLTPETHHLIDDAALARMRRGVMLINTSRGAVVDTRAVIQGLKSGRVGYLGLDVYEEEGDLFFSDLSAEVIQDDVFARLLTFPNVLVTGHQAFLTEEAVSAIARTTLRNISGFERGGVPVENLVTSALVAR